MTLDATKARVAVTGAAYHAPTGTALPTDSTTALNVAFKDVGYIGQDGVTQSINTDETKIVAWQNGDVLRTVQTSHEVTYKFTMVETNAESLAVYYGNWDDTLKVAQIVSDQLGDEAWILSVIDGADIIRVVIPVAQVTNRGDVVFKSDTAIAYEVTLTAYPDASGVKAYVYMSGTDVAVVEGDVVGATKPRSRRARPEAPAAPADAGDAGSADAA